MHLGYKDFDGNVTYQYSAESSSQTDLSFAIKICNAVIDVVKPTVDKKMIINLPNTLEACSANVYADRIEWMCKHLKNREALIVSVHPHNDRGTAVASAELARAWVFCITSGMLVTLEPITAAPDFIASRAGRPKPSCQEGRIKSLQV